MTPPGIDPGNVRVVAQPAPNRNEYQEYFLEGKRRPVRRADNPSTFMCRLSTSWYLQGLSRPVMGLLDQYCVDYSTREILGYAFHYKKCISNSSGLRTKLHSSIRLDSGCLVGANAVCIFILVTMYQPVLCRARRSQSAYTHHRDKSNLKFCLYEVNFAVKHH